MVSLHDEMHNISVEILRKKFRQPLHFSVFFLDKSIIRPDSVTKW